MRRLVVDDLRTFTFPAVYARNSYTGEFYIRDPKGWDEVWFDHDLGGSDTIKPVLEVIEYRAFLGSPVPIGCAFVHTSNPPGAEMLYRTLTKYYPVARVDAKEYM